MTAAPSSPFASSSLSERATALTESDLVPMATDSHLPPLSVLAHWLFEYLLFCEFEPSKHSNHNAVALAVPASAMLIMSIDARQSPRDLDELHVYNLLVGLILLLNLDPNGGHGSFNITAYFERFVKSYP